jgi:hypothetical protein
MTKPTRTQRPLRSARVTSDTHRPPARISGNLRPEFPESTLAARLGKPAAIKAIAHKLARIVYAMMRDKIAYNQQKLIPPITEKMKTKMTARLAAKAHELGYELKKTVLQPNATQGVI